MKPKQRPLVHNQITIFFSFMLYFFDKPLHDRCYMLNNYLRSHTQINKMHDTVHI